MTIGNIIAVAGTIPATVGNFIAVVGNIAAILGNFIVVVHGFRNNFIVIDFYFC
jgi:hypothetical protein